LRSAPPGGNVVRDVRIHCIAVAGTGMGALAGLLRAAGHEVSGSDVAFDPPIGPELERWGVRCMCGFDPAHLSPPPDLVIVGNVCRKDNVEARAAIDGGLRVTTMPHALAEYAIVPLGASPLVVAGTHGKTTTSAMAAWLLEATGRKPGFFIGGLPKNFDTSFRLPAPRDVRRLPISVDQAAGHPLAAGPPRWGRTPFVVEGDEYDTAFFEKTPKFWHYRPEVAILTSIEHDHVDIYPTEASYLDAFREFVKRLPEDGLCIAAANDARVVDIVRSSARCNVSYYALEGDDTHGISAEWMGAPGAFIEGMQQFDLYVGGVACGRLQMPSPGIHNVRNMVAAIAAAAEGYGSLVRDLCQALPRFAGVRRRQDLVGEVRGVRVYDDFAHHPTAVEETLRALKAKHPAGRLWAVFEPRSATACRAIHQKAYEGAFGAADEVILAPLGRSNIPEAERLDLEMLARRLTEEGRPAHAASGIDAIVATLAARVQSGDTVALLSNGSFGGVHQKLLEALAR
jgi:UDP-N-acetylmuramate: L-alanyl-gamma-D-glutamyl-meso-diaminopimelate ligase